MPISLSPTTIWLLVGTILCLSELVLPTAFVAFVLGVSAFMVAAVAHVMPFELQVVLWMGLSAIFVWQSRRLVRGRAAKSLDAVEAETLTEILPGQMGRVRYEGNSWAARCDDHTIAIAPHEKVYVVARKGTTLIVMPETTIHS